MYKKRRLSNQVGNTRKKISADFELVGYPGLKNILDKNNINYTRFTIIQAKQVKDTWE